LNFLKSLKKNNNREWFEKNRAAYEDAKQNVVSMAEFLLRDMAKTDARFAEIKPSSCLFRINRDVRFSKDKSPYKTNFGAAFSVGGKKGPQAGFYVHIDPTAAFAGGGDLAAGARRFAENSTRNRLSICRFQGCDLSEKIQGHVW
jgi:uncharacterized protein (TIGR02453 family)